MAPLSRDLLAPSLGRRQDGGGAPAPEGPGTAKPAQTKGPAGSFDVVFGIICLVGVFIVGILIFYLYLQRRKRQRRLREEGQIMETEMNQQPGKADLVDAPNVNHMELPPEDKRQKGVLG